MQTQRQIQELLAAAGVAPNRRLGQHFLVDLNLMRLLVDSAQIRRNDVVLEVGAGTGSLTGALAEQAGHVVAVEMDRTLAGLAQSHLGGAANVELIHADVLSSKGTFAPAVADAVTGARARLAGRVLLVANLPYDVAASVMIDLVKGPLTADAMTITVQKEVAERMTACPGSRDYGTLSIFLGATGSVERLRVLKPSVFWPPPGVQSALVRYVREGRKAQRIRDMALFGRVVGLFFGHRRKMLRACLKQAPPDLGGRDLWLEVLASSGLDPTRRPEELSPDQYVDLANAYRELAARP